MAQAFAGGTIYNATAGPRSSQTYFVTGLILARYNALGGPGGDYGMPISDEFVTAGVHQQNFEGGNMTWSAGDTAAKEHPAAKTPGLIVSPATLPAGSTARFAIVGFPSNSAIRRLGHRAAEFHGDHGQRRLHVGHVHPALHQERHDDRDGGHHERSRHGERHPHDSRLQRQSRAYRQSAGRQPDRASRGGAAVDPADCVARCRRRPGGGRRGDLPGLQRGAAFRRCRGHRCQWPGRDLGPAAERPGRHAGASRCARGGIRPGDFRTPLGCLLACQFPDIPAKRRYQTRQRTGDYRAKRRVIDGRGGDSPLSPEPRRAACAQRFRRPGRHSISSLLPTAPPMPRGSRPATASFPSPPARSRW